ncbi:MAG: thiamine-phosphate kinase [Proteobacteria bacterium]|nr:thiamine-phosphate kinase [Pseudomonadota bacterium]NIS70036.1 thiamine-phosphate kinase [Pseudomonadota bacterium]
MGRTEIKDIGEFRLIQRIRDRYSKPSEFVPRGIGDDAASLNFPPNHLLLVTTDTLIEDIHFTLKSTIPYLLGAKSLAVNLSDIAAMGGIPRFFLLSLGIPKGYSISSLDRFYRGVSQLAESQGVFLVGGDLAASSKFIINGVVIGHCPPDQVIYRKGAQPGDYIFVTGPLGDAALGLEILRKRGLRPSDFGANGKTRGKDKELLGIIRRHLSPPARVREGRKIAELACATAMIDISDGLLADLRHLIEESQVGANLWLDQIPRSEAFEKWAPLYHLRPIDLALSGGEDYELLFTAPKEILEDKLSRSREIDLPFYPIGEVTPHSKKLSLWTKEKKGYSPSWLGYDHFRGPPKRSLKKDPQHS